MVVPIAVHEVMTRTVETVAPETAAREAAGRLHERGIGSLVVRGESECLGIVTSRDLVGLLAVGDGDTPVREVMSAPLVTVSPDTEVGAAARRLADHDIKKLPVLEGEDLVGIVTVTDLAYYVPPGVVRSRARLGDRDRPAFTDPEVAYDLEDWAFESHGTADGIQVGDSVAFSKPVTEEDVDLFGELSGDTNRLHLDPDYATRTRFGRQIAHGALVGSTVSAALARLPGVIIYLSQQMRYTAPVDLGERVTAVCEVVEHLGDDRFRLSTRVEDADGEAVIEGEATVLSEPLAPE